MSLRDSRLGEITGGSTGGTFSRQHTKNTSESFKKSSPDPPKASRGAFKIEPGALQDAILKRSFIEEGSRGLVQRFLEAKMVNLVPSWRPKTLPNQGQNLKKSMLRNSTFSASMFEGFRPRFGRVWGRVLASKTHAKSERVNCVKT